MNLKYKLYNWTLPGNKQYLNNTISHYKESHPDVTVINDIINL